MKIKYQMIMIDNIKLFMFGSLFIITSNKGVIIFICSHTFHIHLHLIQRSDASGVDQK